MLTFSPICNLEGPTTAIWPSRSSPNLFTAGCRSSNSALPCLKIKSEWRTSSQIIRALLPMTRSTFWRKRGCLQSWRKSTKISWGLNFARIVAVSSTTNSGLRNCQKWPHVFWLGRPQLFLSRNHFRKEDNLSLFYLFRQLVDGLLCLGWVKGREVEASKAEVQSFVHGQRQVEKSGSMRIFIKDLFFFVAAILVFVFAAFYIEYLLSDCAAYSEFCIFKVCISRFSG